MGLADRPGAMRAPSRHVRWDLVTEWNRTWALAVVFGLASIPWTYGFVAGLHLPLWPSFIASATFYAAGDGVKALVRGYASNLVGILYAAATLLIAGIGSGDPVVLLSVAVGGFMFLATLHGFVPLLSFTPGGFLGFATMFSVHAVDATAFGVTGLPGETAAALLAMLIGALIGLGTDEVSALIE